MNRESLNEFEARDVPNDENNLSEDTNFLGHQLPWQGVPKFKIMGIIRFKVNKHYCENMSRIISPSKSNGFVCQFVSLVQ